MASYYRIVSLAVLPVLCVILTIHIAEGIECVTCSGGPGSDCLLKPWKEMHSLSCEKCTNFARLHKENRTLIEITRDCYYRIFPIPIPAEYENMCKNDNSRFIECTHTCDYTDYCTEEISYAPNGWYENGTKEETTEDDTDNNTITTTAEIVTSSDSPVTVETTVLSTEKENGGETGGTTSNGTSKVTEKPGETIETTTEKKENDKTTVIRSPKKPEKVSGGEDDEHSGNGGEVMARTLNSCIFLASVVVSNYFC